MQGQTGAKGDSDIRVSKSPVRRVLEDTQILESSLLQVPTPQWTA